MKENELDTIYTNKDTAYYLWKLLDALQKLSYGSDKKIRICEGETGFWLDYRDCERFSLWIDKSVTANVEYSFCTIYGEDFCFSTEEEMLKVYEIYEPKFAEGDEKDEVLGVEYDIFREKYSEFRRT